MLSLQAEVILSEQIKSKDIFI